jgi:hypothetical protein
MGPETGVEVSYQSANKIISQQARLWYDAHGKAFRVTFLPEEAGETVRLEVKQITGHKARTLKDSAGERPALVIVHGGLMHSFAFATQKDRDEWLDHISHVLRTGALWTIRSINIVDQKDQEASGQVVLLRLDLSRIGEQYKAGVPLRVDEGTTAQNCKDQIVQFVKEQEILDSEGSSLFRLVKAVLQRRQVKQQAQTLVEEIESYHVGEFAQGQSVGADTKDAALEANARLSVLAGQVRDRIGEGGAGAQLLASILEQNIGKLQAVNELVAFPKA